MSEERKNNAYVDNIGAVASGGVGDSVGGHISLFANFDFDSLPLCEIIETMKYS